MSVFSNRSLALAFCVLLTCAAAAQAAGSNLRNRVLNAAQVPAPPLEHPSQASRQLSAPPPPPSGNIVISNPTVTTVSSSAQVAPDARLPVVVAAPVSVSVSSVGAPDTGGFGILKPEEGALPFDIWKGSTRQTFDTLLPLIGPMTPDPEREIASRLLLSAADIPSGDSKKQPLALRLSALFRMGREDDALKLIHALPASVQSGAIKGMEADIQLLKGDTAQTCAIAEAAVQSYDELYWQKLLIFCKAFQGKNAEARLGLDVLEEQARMPEPYFTAMINAMSDKKKPSADIPDSISWSDAGMLLAAGAILPASYLDRAPLPVLRAVAAKSDTAPVTKAQVLERLLAFDAMDASSLASAYQAVPAAAAAKDGAVLRARFYQQQAKLSDMRKKLGLWKQAFDAYDSAGLLPAAWRLYAPLIESLGSPTPSEESQSFARDAYTALLMAGKADAAEPWIALLSKSNPFAYAVGQMTLQFAERSASNVSRVEAPEIPVNAQAVDIKRLFRLYRVMELSGYSLAEANRAQMLTQRPTYEVAQPSPALMQGLAQSGGKTAEQALYALLVLGGGSLSQVGDEALTASLTALKNAGFETQARRLAVESVLALRH